MSKITLTIDDKQVTVESGVTVLNAAEAAGVYIPTLCYHKYLTPFGGCRVCIVEIENMRGFPTSCTTPATDGMVVHTNTEQLQELRRGFLELMLANHPHSCVTCDRRNDCDPYRNSMRKVGMTTGCKFCPNKDQCELQEASEYVGMTEIRVTSRSRELIPDKRDPFLQRDYNLCILCGRCVRVCQEVRGIGAIAFTSRSRDALVGTAFGETLQEADCRFCGACVDICPTGALADRRRKWEGLPDETVVTTCPYCGVGCQFEVEVREGRVIGLIPVAESVNKGQSCVRGRFGIAEIVNHTKRLKVPLMKRNNELVQESWDKALDAVAEKLGNYKGDEIAVINCSEITNEDNYVLQKLARTVLGTNNIDHAARLGRIPVPGRGESKDYISGIANTGCILTIGTDPILSQPVIAVEIKRAVDNGGRLVVASPYRNGLCKSADVWLQYKPGTELVLIGGLMKAVDTAKAARITGVPAEQIEEAAGLYAKAKSSGILYGEGILQQSGADNLISALYDMAAKARKVKKPSLGVNPVSGLNNIQGACDMGVMPGYGPGYQAVEEPGLSFDEMITAIEKGRIKAAYIIGDDPRLKGRLDKLQFLAVQSMFLSSVAQNADVVLPAAALTEKQGTVTGGDRVTRKVNKAVEPRGDSKPDWWITCQIGKRMGGEGFTYRSAGGITTEIKKTVTMTGENQVGITEIDYKASAVKANNDYPLMLITVPSLYYFNAAAMDIGLGEFSLLEGEPELVISPDDAAAMKLENGSEAKLVSKWGELPVKLKVKNTVPVGVTALPLHFAYDVLNPAADKVSGLKEYGLCAVKLEK
ncbi:molybdopterin-dependent oxidoreductase [Chloroflexota bacterium]